MGGRQTGFSSTEPAKRMKALHCSLRRSAHMGSWRLKFSSAEAAKRIRSA